MKRYFKTISVLMLITLASCGQVQFKSGAQDADATASANDTLAVGDSQVFVFASDYASSGQLYLASLVGGETELDNAGVSLLGTEANLKLYDDLLYVLHAGAGFNSVSTDNLQIIDPFSTTNPYRTIKQFSTGNGTNPMDVVIDGGRAFITLYNPEADAANIDANGRPADLIVMSTSTGGIQKRISFYDLLGDDGDRQANAFKMVAHQGVLYVLLQDLSSTTFEAGNPGQIAMLDMSTLQLLGSIVLQSRNPGGMELDTVNDKLIVSAVDDYDTDTDFGGVEIVDLDSQQSEVFIDDEDLGGYAEMLSVAEGMIYAVIAKYDAAAFVFKSKIISMPTSATRPTQAMEFLPFGDDIRSLFFQDGFLWVSFRTISTSTGDSAPNIKVYDTDTEQQVGSTLYPEVAGISMVGER